MVRNKDVFVGHPYVFFEKCLGLPPIFFTEFFFFNIQLHELFVYFGD